MRWSPWVVLSLAMVASPATADALHDQVVGSYKTVRKLLLSKDLKGFKIYMKGIVTPDFRHFENGKTTTLDQMCAEMAQGLGQMKKMNRADESLIGISKHGDKATVMTDHYLQGQMAGGGKKPIFLTFSGTTQDSWLKVHGKWKLQRMEWIRQMTLINGHPVGPTPRMTPKMRAG